MATRYLAGIEECMHVQVVGNHGEVLGTISYSAGIHGPKHPAQQAVQTTLQQQPESQQHRVSLSHVTRQKDSTSTDSSGSAVSGAAGSSDSHGLLQQPVTHAAAADAAASQDSTALNAFKAQGHALHKQDMKGSIVHDQHATQAVAASREDAESEAFLPSSSGEMLAALCSDNPQLQNASVALPYLYHSCKTTCIISYSTT